MANRPIPEWDIAGLLKLMWETWNDVFRTILGPAERGFVGELRGHRNRWAHRKRFSSDDACRALDSIGRLPAAVSAPQSDELETIKMELLRVRFDEQSRGERRRRAGLANRVVLAGAPTPASRTAPANRSGGDCSNVEFVDYNPTIMHVANACRTCHVRDYDTPSGPMSAGSSR